MRKMTIHLDDETEKLMRAAAKFAGVPKGEWIAGLIRERLVVDWPEHIRALAGAWPDFPLVEEIRDGKARDSKCDKL